MFKNLVFKLFMNFLKKCFKKFVFKIFLIKSYLTERLAVLSLLRPILRCFPMIKYVLLTLNFGQPHLSSCFFTQIAPVPTLILVGRYRREWLGRTVRSGRKRVRSGRVRLEPKIYFLREEFERLTFGVQIWTKINTQQITKIKNSYLRKEAWLKWIRTVKVENFKKVL